jgi:hypothetical protein
MSLVIIKGIPAITWGSGGALGGPAGAIVESYRLTPKNASVVGEIEDNSGLAANLVFLRDGFNAKLNCLYDGNKAWPVEGANVGLNLAINGANANSYPFGEGNAASFANGVVTYYCTVASIEPAGQRKKEEMIELNLIYRPNVSP